MTGFAEMNGALVATLKDRGGHPGARGWHRPLVLGIAIMLYASCAKSDGMTGANYRLIGRVLDGAGKPAVGAFVTASAAETGVGSTTLTDDAGIYRFPDLPPGDYDLQARAPGIAAGESVRVGIDHTETALERDLGLGSALGPWDDAPAAQLLGLLPQGETKRRFILDCTGCHPFDQRTIESGDGLKSRDEWESRTAQMIQFAGGESGFPIMSPSRRAGPTADWLAEHLGPTPGSSERPELPSFPSPDPGASRAVITEYEFPVPGDLPHDLVVDIDGRVVVTGMLSNQMWILDPQRGAWDTPVELPAGNPRALDIDAAGNWYVALGAPQRLAMRERTSGEWRLWELGEYPHSVQLDRQGRLWFNGHFSRDPERIGYVETADAPAREGSGEAVRHIEVPSAAMADGGRTIQYGLRTGADGSVWTTQLAGGRLIRFEPSDDGPGRFRMYDLPTPHSGPRRPDLDADGLVWIPEYANNRLARFDPVTETFREYVLPLPDALPYVVRVDRRRNVVWIGTGAADAIISFDPDAERFSVYPLPTRGALIRHIDVDERSGDVWAAYGASPARTPNKIARLANH